MTVKSVCPGLKKEEKEDIKIIIVVTNILNAPQAAKLLLPVMPYFHSILELPVKTSQEKRRQQTPEEIWSLRAAPENAIG